MDKNLINVVQEDHAFRLLYKFLRKENILYEYCYEVEKNKNREASCSNTFLIPMRERIKNIISQIIEDNKRWNWDIGMVFSFGEITFYWDNSSKKFSFWNNKSFRFYDFLEDYGVSPTAKIKYND